MPLSKKDKIQIGIIACFLILGTIRVISLFTRTTSSLRGGEADAARLSAGRALGTTVPGDRPGEAISGIKIASPAEKRGGLAMTTITETQNPNIADGILSTQDMQLKRSKQRWGRDPFFGLPIEDSAFEPPPESNTGELVLSGISLKGKRAMAIVNRTIVREGDVVFGMKVLAIERDRVVFAQNSHEVILRFGGTQ